jgi:hypothetical protein
VSWAAGGPRVAARGRDFGRGVGDNGPCLEDARSGHDLAGGTWQAGRRSAVPQKAVVTMSGPRPHSAADLALAPVLISIERNLARLRDSSDLAFDLALQLNDDAGWYHTPVERAGRVIRAATREVDLHGWSVAPACDLQGLAVRHGEYQVTLSLGGKLAGYVAHGPAAHRTGARA